MSPWLLFLILTLLCLVFQSFFSMFEMACVSLNKVRFQYAISKNQKWAIWLNQLLAKPSRLFVTTLIGVNAFLQLGSECSRRFYESLNLSPDFAPITQVFLVLVFAELAPMFAARRHPEHVSMLGIPFMVLLYRLFIPIAWAVDGFSYLVARLFGKDQKYSLFLSREEVQRAFEEKDSKEQREDLVFLVNNLFSLKSKMAKDFMGGLDSVQLIPSEATLQEVRHILSVNYTPFIPIYHRSTKNIVAVAYPRDLLRLQPHERIIEHAKPPWFISDQTSVLEILKQFQRNNQMLAIVLDSSGQALGTLTLNQIVDQVFGQEKVDFMQEATNSPIRLVERTLPGDMTLAEFNDQFHAHISYKNAKSLSDLVTMLLKHPPARGESVFYDQYELIVIETSLMGVKTLLIRTLSN